MTLEKLNEHWKTLQSISNDREMLQKLERSIAPHSPILSGMPHAPGLSDRTADYAEEILVVHEDLKRLEAVSQVEEKEIIPFIEYSRLPNEADFSLSLYPWIDMGRSGRDCRQLCYGEKRKTGMLSVHDESERS